MISRSNLLFLEADVLQGLPTSGGDTGAAPLARVPVAPTVPSGSPGSEVTEVLPLDGVVAPAAVEPAPPPLDRLGTFARSAAARWPASWRWHDFPNVRG